jgi:hypothetical protein
VILVEGEAELSEVVLALGPGGGRPDLLDRPQGEADDYGQDADQDHQLDEREGRPKT